MAPDTVKSACFAAIYDILLTNDRLAAIHLTDTSTCSLCRETDTIQPKITECVEGRLIWTLTRARLGMILRMEPRHISLGRRSGMPQTAEIKIKTKFPKRNQTIIHICPDRLSATKTGKASQREREREVAIFFQASY